MIKRSAAKFVVRPVVAAVAVALSGAGAIAAPTPNQMPGAGRVEAISAGGGVRVNGAAPIPVLTPITSLANGSRIDIQGQVVLNWGVTGGPADINPSGFNLGAGATLFFGASPAVLNPAVLNVDVSGNASQLFGNLIATSAGWAGCPGCVSTPQVYVANANGIVVGAGGRIVAPVGVGLLGANFNSALQRDEFVGNNSSTTSFVDVIGGQSSVQIHGSINGDFALNVPAAYVLLAGGSITNTGTIFTNQAIVEAGLRAAPALATVNGVTGVTVHRLFDATFGILMAGPVVGTLPGDLEIATPGQSIVNTGSISSKAFIGLNATGDVRSGTAGNTDTQVGLFADFSIGINSFSSSGKVELYNVVSGYATNKSLASMLVNGSAVYSGFSPDTTINALTPGSQPSSITTAFDVWIFGGNVTINSTINHKDTASGGAQFFGTKLDIVGSKSVTIAANIGAGGDVNISSVGPLSISGDVLSDTSSSGFGGIHVANTGAGATTNITGNLLVPAGGLASTALSVLTNGPTTVSGSLTNVAGDVEVVNYGTGVGNFTTISGNVTGGDFVEILNQASTNTKPLAISGNVTGSGVSITNLGSAPGNTTLISGNVTTGGGSLYVSHYGIFDSLLTITGALSADNDIWVGAGGNASVGVMNAGADIDIQILGTSLMLNGALTAGNDVDINARTATTLAYPAAVITAPEVYLDVLHFTGVNAAGLPYASLAEKPAAQIVTNELDVDITGSINAPIAGNTNWLNNSVMVAPFSPLSSVEVSVSATGGGFQAVNIGVNGNMIADSGTTTTPFIGVPLTTGGFPAGGLQGNVGSSLILHASGSVTMIGAPTGSLFGPPLAFQFPGGIAVKAGTTLTTMTPVYNAWTTVAIPFQGQWYEAPYIVIGSFLATSGNTWTNFSSAPVSGFPTTYQIREINPSSYGFALAPEAVHKNTYSAAILGGPICMTGGPTTFTVCP